MSNRQTQTDNQSSGDAAETGLVVVGPHAVLPFDYGDDVGGGYENQTSRDRTIPFLVLCQSQTPMVEDERARAGDYFNTVTEEVYPRDSGFLFVPAITMHQFALWQPRENGGGFRGHLPINDPKVVRAQQECDFGELEITRDSKDGKQERLELRETFYVYGVVCDDEGNVLSMGVALSFWSSKIRVYKSWMTRLSQFPRAPLYAHLTRFTSTREENDKGAFYVPVARSADPRGIMQSLLSPDDPRFLAAKELRESINKGMAKIDYSTQAAGGEGDGDIPF